MGCCGSVSVHTSFCSSQQRFIVLCSNIIEDLGRVTYVFSDKTGTLTSNEMRMRAVAIKGIPYGGTDFRWGSHTGDPQIGDHAPLSV